MAFKIPKGKTYKFRITVLERDSYLPQDLADMDVVGSSFELIYRDTLEPVLGTITIARIVDDKLLPADPDTYANGRILITIPDTVTSALEYERGPKIDGYYAKPTYEGVITVKFTDGTSDIVAVLKDICVIPTGV